ncbi:Uma2 family endonuclease [Streptomyces harbinensis]|uniref:Uma2 family endonuclease n=1 Tax=Streptomyces harbinensis TaxID=1176198 RepID=UPI00370FA39D
MTMVMEQRESIGSRTPASFEELCRMVEEMEVPDGFRAEIIEGKIVVSPWSKGTYRPVMRSIVQQLSGHEPEGHVIDTGPHLFTFAGQGRAYGPDIHVSDESATLVDSIHLPGESLSLVAELTSAATADIDRVDKVLAYGRAGVPVYLLVDMLESTVTVYHSPSETGYRRHNTLLFGDSFTVPRPFDCKLDTSGW